MYRPFGIDLPHYRDVATSWKTLGEKCHNDEKTTHFDVVMGRWFQIMAQNISKIAI